LILTILPRTQRPELQDTSAGCSKSDKTLLPADTTNSNSRVNIVQATSMYKFKVKINATSSTFLN
jgi:hypothetical protein